MTPTRRWAVALTLALGVLIAAGAALAADGTPEMDMVGSSDLSGAKENLPGYPFVFASYLIVWGGLFAYLLSVWRRQRKVAAEVEELKALLVKHDARAAGRGGAA